MRLVPCGKLLTVGTIREFFAKQNGADFTEPITAGIFVQMVAWASYQRAEDNPPLADFLGCTVDDLLDKIEEFKDEGCTLFK